MAFIQLELAGFQSNKIIKKKKKGKKKKAPCSGAIRTILAPSRADFAAFWGLWGGMGSAELTGCHTEHGAPSAIAVRSQNIRLVILEGLRVSVYSINGR